MRKGKCGIPSMNTTREKHMFRGLKYLIKLVYKMEKGYIISLLMMEILSGILTFAYIIFPKFIIDSLFTKQEYEQSVYGYIFLYAFSIVLCNILMAYLKYYSEIKRDSLYKKYSIIQGRQFMNCEYAKLEDPEFLKLREQSTKYINAYGFAGIINIATQIVGKLVTLISILSIITMLDYRICIIYIVLTGINLIVNIRFKRNIISKDIAMAEAERKTNYFKSIFEDKKYAKEIRIYSLKQWFLDKLAKSCDLVNGYKFGQNKNNMKRELLIVITEFLQQIVAYSYLIYSAIQKKITVGNFTMFLGSIITFNNCIMSIANILIDLKQYDEYFEPFIKFNNYLMENENKMSLIEPSDSYCIEFKNVSFKYPGQERYVLKNISVKFQSGESICIVGENGAGKSTFIKLLLRFYIVDEGEILLNEKNINEYSYTEYMELFSSVFQDYKLLALSIKENIVLNNGDKNKKTERLKKAIELSGVEKMIDNKEVTLDTAIYKLFDEKGLEPSGGESQKIALARAIYKDTPILILDEPSSALDPVSEMELLDKFKEMSKDKLTLFISHRLTSAIKCSRVIVFDEGFIVEDGNHQTLLKEKGLYSNLFEMQKELYI